jgi:hypothetical protein
LINEKKRQKALHNRPAVLLAAKHATPTACMSNNWHHAMYFCDENGTPLFVTITMLAAYKSDAKETRRARSPLKVRMALGRSRSASPTASGTPDSDGLIKRGSLQLGNMNAVLAQPSWATHLQSKIASVTDAVALQQLHGAMLDFSMQNATYSTDFLRPQECRCLQHPIPCSIGRCVHSLHTMCSTAQGSDAHGLLLQVSRRLRRHCQALFGCAAAAWDLVASCTVAAPSSFTLACRETTRIRLICLRRFSNFALRVQWQALGFCCICV